MQLFSPVNSENVNSENVNKKRNLQWKSLKFKKKPKYKKDSKENIGLAEVEKSVDKDEMQTGDGNWVFE